MMMHEEKQLHTWADDGGPAFDDDHAIWQGSTRRVDAPAPEGTFEGTFGPARFLATEGSYD